MRQRIRAHAGETVGGLASVALGAAILLHIRDFRGLPGGYPGPALFPGILAALFVVFGVGLLVQVLRGTVVTAEAPQMPSEAWTVAVPNAAAMILAVPAYLLLAPRLGFMLSMSLLCAALMLKLRTHPVLAVVVSVAAVLATSYIFADILRVPLPRGPIGR